MTVPSSDFHIHTTFCDGSAEPEAYAEKALSMGLTSIGFTAHAAWPMTTGCELYPDRYYEYKAEILRLKKLYAGRLNIFLGLETDYLPPLSSPDSPFYGTFGLDYKIGSVHYICNPDRPELGMFAIDDKTQIVADGIRTIYGGDCKRTVQTYFAAVRNMIENCSFDIIGHMDVIRKRNRELNLFDENDAWYRHELEATAKAAARSGKIVEINTGGMARKTVDTPYPSPYLLELLHSLDVPVTFDSDAHNPENLGFGFKEAATAALRAGYREYQLLTDDGWKAQPLET